MLEYVLKLQGSKKITLGTDYPFPLGDLEVGKFIEDMELDASIKEDIFAMDRWSGLEFRKKDLYSL
jgi:aminocarboxymuconate-semialdehyde decarboxylase